MQDERQLGNQEEFSPTPYSVRQRLLSASLSLAISGSMTVTYASANTGIAGWTAPVITPTTHTVVPVTHNVASTSTHTVPTSSTHALVAPVVNKVSVSTLHPVVSAHGASSTTTTSTTHSTKSSSSSHTTSTALAFQHNSSASASTTPAKNDLDLNSAQPMFAAGTLANFTTLSIVVGGKVEQVNVNTKLTAAELLASQQVLAGGKQTIDINKSGIATGGTYSLNAANLAQLDTDLGGSIGSVYIPHGVKLIDSVSTLNLGGALTNYGSIVTVNSSAKSVDTIDASNIVNAAGAHITSGTAAAPSAALSLDTGNLSNSGTIYSSGNLNVIASNLTNSGSLGASQAVNLTVPSVTNSGTISSTHSDINFNSTQNIVLNNAGGTVKASSGDINFRDASYSGGSNITVTGGSLLSNNVNLNGGSGNVNASVDSVTGRVNTVADTVHITSSSGDLILGNQNIKGDPTYFNTNGNVTIYGDIVTNGNDLAIVASGNILTGNYANEGIDTSSDTGNGGNVTLIAGANFTSNGLSTGSNDTSTMLTISNSTNPGKGSLTGGYVDLDGLLAAKGTSAPMQNFLTNSATAQAGDLTVIAYHGTAANSGTVVFPGASSDTQLIGGAPAQNGDLTIIADGGLSSSTAGSILIGNVEARNINIYGATPNLLSPVTITDGTASNSVAAGFTPGTSSQSFIQFGTLTGTNVTVSTANEVDGGVGSNPSIVVAGQGGVAGTATAAGTNGGSGGNVTINAGSGIFVNSIDASGGGGGGGSAATGGTGGNGGSGGSGGTIVLTALGDNIETFGALNVSGGGGGGAAGDASSTFSGGAGGSAGTITISTPYSIITGGALVAVAGANGSVNNGLYGGGGGGSYGGGGGGGSASGSDTSDGGGGGAGSYGGGGGGGTVLTGTPTGGGGGSAYTVPFGQGGSGGASGSGGGIAAEAGGLGFGGNGGGQGNGIGGASLGISGTNGLGVAGINATTSGSGTVNLTFGTQSYAGTPTVKTPIIVDASMLSLTGKSSTGSISITNDSGVGNLTIASTLTAGASLTVNAQGGNLTVNQANGAIVNLTAAGNLNIMGAVTATTSSILNAANITANAPGSLITTPSLSLQSSSGTDISVNTAVNNLTVQATGSGASVVVTESATSTGALNVLASTIGNSLVSGAGSLTVNSAQQVNLNGSIATGGSAGSSGSMTIDESGSSAVGIAINAAQTVLGAAGQITLIASPTQSITDATVKVLSASSITLSGGNMGTAAAPVATNVSTGIMGDTANLQLTLNPGLNSAVYLRDSSANSVLLQTESVAAVGQTLSLTTTSSILTVGNLNFNNVTISDSLKTGQIVLNSLAQNTQIGAGAGTIALTAGSSISQSQASVGVTSLDGTKVTLVSTGGSVGSNADLVQVNSPVLAATATLGSVYVNDLASNVTLSGSASSVGTNIFDVTGSFNLTTSGVISGANVILSALNTLTLGGNVTTPTATGSVGLNAASLVEGLATATATGATIELLATSGGMGTSVLPIVTAASKELLITSGLNVADSAYVKQNGALTLGADDNNTITGNNINLTASGAARILGSVDTSGTFSLSAAGAITLGDGVATESLSNTLGSVILTSTAGITVSSNYSVGGDSLTYNSGTGAIALAGTSTATTSTAFNATGKSSLTVTGAGTLDVGTDLTLTAGGAITIGATNSPLLNVLGLTSLTSLQINAGTTFSSPLYYLQVGPGGTLDLTASSVLYNGIAAAPDSTVFQLNAGSQSMPGSVDLNLTGTAAISLSTSPPPAFTAKTFTTFSAYSAGEDSVQGGLGGGGTDTISTAGSLTTNTTNSLTLAFTEGSNLTLQGTGLSITGGLNNEDAHGDYHPVTLNDNASAAFTIGGGGPVNTANTLNGALNASAITVKDTVGIKVIEPITAESAQGVTFTTAAFSAAGGSVNVDGGTLTINNPLGAVAIAAPPIGSPSSYTNVGSVVLSAGKGALTVSDPTLVVGLFENSSLANLTLSATGALTLPTTGVPFLAVKDSLFIQAASDNFTPGIVLKAFDSTSTTPGSVTLITTNPIVVGGSNGTTGVTIEALPAGDSANGGSITVQSSGALTVNGEFLFFGNNNNAMLSLSGTNVAITHLADMTYGSLSITSNSATAFTVGATTTAQGLNGVTFVGYDSLTAGTLSLTNKLGGIASGLGVTAGSAAVTGTTSVALTAHSGITGSSTTPNTPNFIVSTPSLSATTALGTVNLEVQGGGTQLASASAGTTGIYNLKADDAVVFGVPLLQASSINLTTGASGSFTGVLMASAPTLAGLRNDFGVGASTNMLINDTYTGTTTIGSFLGTSDSSLISINTAGAIAVSGSLTNLLNTGLTAGGTAGNITLGTAAKFSDIGASDVVTLIASGTGTITNSAGTTPSIVATNLALDNGTGAVSATPLRVDAGHLTLGAGGAYNISELATTPESLTLATAGTIKSLQYVATATSTGSINTLNFTGANTSNGSITLSANATEISVSNGPGIASVTTTAGSISILNTNTIGAIDISDAIVYGSGTAAGVGQVTFAIGAIPAAATLSPGTLPGNLAILPENGGQVYFGTTTYPQGTITVNGSGNTATANGRNIIFNQAGGNITVENNSQITADPPVITSSPLATTAASTSALVTAPVVSSSPSQAAIENGARFELTSLSSSSNSATAASVLNQSVTSPVFNNASGVALTSSPNNTSLSAGQAITSIGSSSATTSSAGTSDLSLASALAANPSSSLSTAGQQAIILNSQPAGSVSLNSDDARGPSVTNLVTIGSGGNQESDGVSFSGRKAFGLNAASRLTGAPVNLNKVLVGGIDNTTRLDKGAMLIAADRNQTLKTEYGAVTLAKDSLVLAIAFDHGIAVYNLHDTKRGAVSVSFRNHNILIAPGQHVLLTDRNVQYFEEINPVNFVGYRNMDAKDLGDGVKRFHAEFDILSMFRGLEPLRQMFDSPDVKNRKAVMTAIKTAALISQMSKSTKQFEMMNLSPATAMIDR